MSRAQDYLSKTEKGDLFWSGGAVFVAAAHNVEQRDGIFFAILGMSWLLILIKVARRDPHLALHVCLVLLATTVHGARVLARRRPVAAPVLSRADVADVEAKLRAAVAAKAWPDASTLLRRLSAGDVSLDIIKTTSIGKTVATLKKAEDGKLAMAAKGLVARWKQMVRDADAK
mmetsp:Transcript_5202/g.16408  ORF Transcript_5202/g.16408 Transcript_5202/m.16408 type:complete len:173 (+) Transcript_5202:104-622(+)